MPRSLPPGGIATDPAVKSVAARCYCVKQTLCDGYSVSAANILQSASAGYKAQQPTHWRRRQSSVIKSVANRAEEAAADVLSPARRRSIHKVCAWRRRVAEVVATSPWLLGYRDALGRGVMMCLRCAKYVRGCWMQVWHNAGMYS
ncbi:hypothetical protein KCP78_03550 [Salmonella enterica subsp. enterica]|nr:hypothetical protein KCP78_03550 [Salmonella enterica subsp. enterica]